MEAVRDLGITDPWQESLDRSRGRRREEARREPGGGAPARVRRAPVSGRRAPVSGRRAPAGHRGRLRRALGALGWGVLTPALLIAAGATASSANVEHASTPATHVAAAGTHQPGVLLADSGGAALGSIADLANAAGTCRPVGRSSGYVNPLAGDTLLRERIDQGVDYAGSGSLRAIGSARITYLGTSGTGWPGAFLEYKLLSGPDTGCFVYYAEGITPDPGLAPGQTVSAGQVLATIIPTWPTGIELGWGAGQSTKSYAALVGGWTAGDDEENFATEAGRSFSALIAHLGGPPGKIEG